MLRLAKPGLVKALELLSLGSSELPCKEAGTSHAKEATWRWLQSAVPAEPSLPGTPTLRRHTGYSRQAQPAASSTGQSQSTS